VDILISLEFPTGREVEVATSPGETETTRTAGSTGEEQATFVVLENVGIAALTGWRPATAEGEGVLPSGATEARPPTAILFALSPQDALVLKYVKDAGGVQDIVLRAPGAEGPFDTEPVDVDYVLNRFQIPNEVGR
jgi:pilus assembly protein CpaB